MAAAAVAIGAGIKAYGAILQGQAQGEALDRAAQIEEQNAALDIKAGEVNAQISSIQSSKKIGQITAGYGASGVSGDSGSVLDVLASSTASAELDRQNILHGAKVRAVNYENQAEMDRIGATSARQGSYFNALSEAFGGGSKAFSYGSGVEPGKYEATKNNKTAGGSDNDMVQGGSNTVMPTESLLE